DDSLLVLFTIECRSKAVDSEDFDDVYADREMLVDAKPREKVKIKVPGWRSINGVSCICPSFDPDIIGSSAGVSVQVSLDEGQTLLGPPLPFKVFSFTIDRIVPAVGEAALSTRMEIVLGGRMPVVTKKPRIGAILPGESDAAGRRRRPLMREMSEAVAEARADGTIRIFFTMPSLEDLLPEKTVAVAERYLKIPIEVSLNDGAEYSEDGFSFTYLLPQGAEGDSPTFTAAPGLYKMPEEWTEEDNRIDVSAAIPAGTEMCVRLAEGDLPVDLVYADAKIRLRYVPGGEDEGEGAELKPPVDLEVVAGISFHGEKDIPVLGFTTPEVTASQLAVELGTVVAMEVSFAIDGQHFHEVTARVGPMQLSGSQVVDDEGQASSSVREELNPVVEELRLKPSVDPGREDPGNDALLDFYSAVGREDEELVRSVVADGRPLIKLNSLRASPLLLSLWNNNPRILSLLLDAGADGVSGDKRSGFAPLHHASLCQGASECIKLLVQYDADLLCRTSRGGYTPLFLACALGITDNVATLLAMALQRAPAVSSLPGRAFIESCSTTRGHTCLVAAVRTGNRELVSLLVHCRASVLAADPNGITPVEAAKGRDDMLEALLGRSARRKRSPYRPLPAALAAGGLHRSASSSEIIPSPSARRVLPNRSLPPRRGGGFLGISFRRDGRAGFLNPMSIGRVPEAARMRRVRSQAQQNMRLMDRNLVVQPMAASASVRQYEMLLSEEGVLKSQRLLESQVGGPPGETARGLRKILMEKQKIGRRQVLDGLDLMRWCCC
ncbi:hypothetical protein FOZ62_020551, partial [Perkinsus olseni]